MFQCNLRVGKTSATGHNRQEKFQMADSSVQFRTSIDWRRPMQEG